MLCCLLVAFIKHCADSCWEDTHASMGFQCRLRPSEESSSSPPSPECPRLTLGRPPLPPPAIARTSINLWTGISRKEGVETGVAAAHLAEETSTAQESLCAAVFCAM